MSAPLTATTAVLTHLCTPGFGWRESDTQRTPGVDTGCYIKSCKQLPALSSTSASAPLLLCVCMGDHFWNPLYLFNWTPPPKKKKSDPLKHRPRITWTPLFIYISIGLSMFYSSHFYHVVKIFFPPSSSLFNFIFSHGRELLLVQASVNRCRQRLPVLTEGSILTLSW